MDDKFWRLQNQQNQKLQSQYNFNWLISRSIAARTKYLLVKKDPFCYLRIARCKWDYKFLHSKENLILLIIDKNIDNPGNAGTL